MKRLKIGVVGAGHLGSLHTKMLSQIEAAQLVGVFDINSETGKRCAGLNSTTYFESLENLIHECDAVSIATTTKSHHEIAKKSLEHGLHLFIEKPITATIPEAEDMVEIAESKKLKIQVGHIERFNPALLSLEKYTFEPMFIQTDRLAQFNPRGTDVAVVLDLMIHDIDIILHLVKSDVKKIDASGVAVVSSSVDIANARIEFENGAVANVTASRISQKKMRKMRIFQRDNYISLDFNTGVSEVFRLKDIGETASPSQINFGEIGIGEKRKMIVYEQPEIREVNALRYELELFIDSVLNDKPTFVTGEDGLKALKVADIIMQKINESQNNFKSNR